MSVTVTPTAASHTERLARRAAKIAAHPLPQEVAEAGKACLLHGLAMACAASAKREPVRDLLLSAAIPDGHADLLVEGRRAQSADAAAANAALFASRGQNDTHPLLAGHVGCVVIPAILAAGQAHGAAGEDLLRGLVAGYEVIVCLAEGITDVARARGLRMTSLLGPAGAAAAVAAMLKLDVAAIAAAIAFGLDAGSGMLRCWAEGSAEWRWQAARCAADGVTAAYIARAGAPAARFAFEGERGFLSAHIGTAVPAPSTRAAWHVLDVELKAFPGCYINQAASAALLTWLDGAAPLTSEISSVEVLLNPADAAYPGVANRGPFTSSASAVMSLPFMAAAAIEHGSIRASVFEDGFAEGPLHALSRRVAVVGDERIAPYGAEVRLSLASGGGEVLSGISIPRARQGVAATAAMLSSTSAEWPWSDAGRRFADLVAVVETLEIRSIDDLLRPCLP